MDGLFERAGKKRRADFQPPLNIRREQRRRLAKQVESLGARLDKRFEMTGKEIPMPC